jgi:hypothetical protein
MIIGPAKSFGCGPGLVNLLLATTQPKLLRIPFACRKALPDNLFLCELVIEFRNSGYVALYEIEDTETLTVLAMRHQREEDFF